MSRHTRAGSQLKAAFFIIVCTIVIGILECPASELDHLYGKPALPSHIKYYEVDIRDKMMLNPYLQVAKEHKAILDSSTLVYNWIIDISGNICIGEPVAHPQGRHYETDFTRPEDGYQQPKGYVEKYGHVSASAGVPARISGEIVNDTLNRRWVINNKSGRYSRGINDRTPDKLMNAAALIRERVDPGGQQWGAIVYLLDYGPEKIKKEAICSVKILYAFPEKKKLPYIILLNTMQ